MLDPNTASPATSTPRGSKRIPASLMNMRRASLANSGKYKLPTLDAKQLPDNSLTGMAASMRAVKATTPSSYSLPAFCTPMRTTPKTLQITLDEATDLLSNPDWPSSNPRSSRCSGSRTPARRSKSMGVYNNDIDIDDPIQRHSSNSNSNHHNMDMESLVRSGLATPRRSSRRTLRIPTAATAESPASKRLSSKTRSKTVAVDPLGESSSNSHKKRSSSSSGVRRCKSVEDAVPRTPRRLSRSSTSSTSHPKKKGDNSEDSVSDTTISSDITMQSTVSTAALLWKCVCGEEHEMECGFCGMCGATQRWECADCGYANKCKFKFCGMCGIVKKVKGDQ